MTLKLGNIKKFLKDNKAFLPSDVLGGEKTTKKTDEISLTEAGM